MRWADFLTEGPFAIVAWFGGVMGILALWRRARGLPILKPRYRDQVYSASGISAGKPGLPMAKGCVWVTITETRLRIGLHVPFSLIFPPVVARLLGYELDVPLEQVTRVERSSRMFFPSLVSVSWVNDSDEESVEVSAGEAFGQALRAATALTSAARR
jgi:hypothetical protein